MATASQVLGLDRESIEYLIAALDAAFDGVALIDLDLKFVYANPALCEMAECESPQDMLGRDVGEFVTEETLSALGEHVAAVLAGGRVRFEGLARAADGGLVPIEVGASLLREADGQPYVFLAIVRDIAERKRAEEALRASETRYRLLFENLNDAAFLADAETGTILETNKQAEVLLGRSRDEIVGMHQTRLHPPGRAEEYRRKFEKHVHAGHTVDFDGEVMRKDGSILAVAISAAVTELEGRRLILGLFHDITERKRAEDALRQSQEEYRVICEESPHGIVIADSETRQLVYANPCMCRLLGYTEKELLQLGVADIHPKESLDHVASEFESQARGEKTLAPELPCLRKDGTVFYADVTASPIILDGGQRCLVGFFADVTERKQVEHQLRERMKELQALYGLAEITEREGITLDKLYQEYTNILPKSWQYPEIACARIVIGDSEFRTENFAESPWKQSAPVKVNGSVVGGIDVGYLEQKPGENEGPFLKEERLLIDAVAERIGRITGRKRAEEALQQSEGRLRTLIESLPQKIFYKDRGSVYVWCNDKYARDLGISAAEICGKTDDEFHPAELAGKYRADDRRVMDSAATEDIEERYIEAGEERWVHTIKTPVADGNGNTVGVLGIFWDITQRKRAEEALRQSEERYRALFENMGVGVTLVREDRTVVAVNPAIAGMFHTSADEMVGKLCYREFEKRNAVCAHCPATKALQTGTPQEVITAGVRDDGTQFTARVCAFPVPDADGKCRSFIEVVEDVTERQRMEQALEVKHRELESFVYTVSHDLRAPLVSLEGFAKLLADEYSDRLDDEGQDYLRRLRANVNTMNSLLTDLLELSRIGRKEEPAVIVPAKETVADALESLNSSVVQSGAHVEVPDDLPAVHYSRTRLLQVFTNLISNAIKFSREGEVPRVEIGWQPIAGAYRFSVKDNGIGIQESHRQRVFEIFSRLRQKDIEGTGVGLAIVQRIVENYGGTVGVDSIPGQGSTFWFTVPKQAATDLRRKDHEQR